MTEPLPRSDRFRGGKGVKKDEEDKNILQINQQTKDKNDRHGKHKKKRKQIEVDKEYKPSDRDDGDKEESEKAKFDEVVDEDEEGNNTIQIKQQPKDKNDRHGKHKEKKKQNEEDEEYKPSAGDDEDDEDEEESEVEFKLDHSIELAVIQFVEESTASCVNLYNKLYENGGEKQMSKDIESSSRGKGILYELILSTLIKEDYGEDNSKLTMQTFGSKPDERTSLVNAIENEHLKYLLNDDFKTIKTMYQTMAKSTCSLLAEKIKSIMMKRPLEGSDFEEESADTHNEEDKNQEEDIISETDSAIDVTQVVPEQVFQYEYNFQQFIFSSKYFIESIKIIVKRIAYEDSKFGYLYFILPSSGKSYLFHYSATFRVN